MSSPPEYANTTLLMFPDNARLLKFYQIKTGSIRLAGMLPVDARIPYRHNSPHTKPPPQHILLQKVLMNPLPAYTACPCGPQGNKGEKSLFSVLQQKKAPRISLVSHLSLVVLLFTARSLRSLEAQRSQSPKSPTRGSAFSASRAKRAVIFNRLQKGERRPPADPCFPDRFSITQSLSSQSSTLSPQHL